MELTGKVAVVLGASAEGGTGWAIAETLAQAGARVVVGARRIEPLRKLAAKVDGLAVACDAAYAGQIEALARAAVDAYGPIDIAVNSAGLAVVGSIAKADPAQLQRSLDVNYLAHVYFLQKMTAVMNDGGSAILVSSLSGARPLPPFGPYGCAKAATDMLVRFAAVEFGPRGIRVNSILPGPIKTPLAAAVFDVPGVEEFFSKEIPLGRVGLPQDFADVVRWLAGPGYITGVNLPVTGGIHLTHTPRIEEISGNSAYDEWYQN